jgi:hypothetical protein
MDTAVLQGVLIDQTVEIGFEFTRHLRGSAAAGSIHEATCAFVSKALHPFPQGRIGKVEGSGDGFDGLSRRHFTHRLSAAKDTSFLGLLHECV